MGTAAQPSEGASDLPAPGSPRALRTRNEQRLLDVLRDQAVDAEPPTQAALARATGLAPATVSNIVGALHTAGLVEVEPGSGRRGARIRLARSAGAVVGIDIGHSHVTVAVGDLTGRILGRVRTALDPNASHESGLRLAEAGVRQLLVDLDLDRAALRTLVLGLPAPIKDGVPQSSAILPGWVGVNARVLAEKRFGLPVAVDNDANLGALAEHRVGAARGHDSSLFVKVSSGVGAGVVIQGRLLHGAGGVAGEIGHLTVDETGPVCRCGSRGCLETYASVPAVQQMLSAQLPGAGVEEIIAAARGGHVGAFRALVDAGSALGWGVAAAVNLLNPAVVVIGGELARAGDLLVDSVRSGMRRHVVDAAAGTPVVIGREGESASLVGAVLLAAEATELSV